MTTQHPPQSYPIAARYGLRRSLSPLGEQPDGCRHYILWGESRFVRGGFGMIDFEGGPFVSTGEFLDPADPQPVRLVDCIGQMDCVDPREIVVEARWMEPRDAAYALGEDAAFVNPQSNKSFAMIKTRI